VTSSRRLTRMAARRTRYDLGLPRREKTALAWPCTHLCYPSSENGCHVNAQNHHKLLILLARPKRFELLTPRFVVWCSMSTPQQPSN